MTKFFPLFSILNKLCGKARSKLLILWCSYLSPFSKNSSLGVAMLLALPNYIRENTTLSINLIFFYLFFGIITLIVFAIVYVLWRRK